MQFDPTEKMYCEYFKLILKIENSQNNEFKNFLCSEEIYKIGDLDIRVDYLNNIIYFDTKKISLNFKLENCIKEFIKLGNEITKLMLSFSPIKFQIKEFFEHEDYSYIQILFISKFKFNNINFESCFLTKTTDKIQYFDKGGLIEFIDSLEDENVKELEKCFGFIDFNDFNRNHNEVIFWHIKLENNKISIFNNNCTIIYNKESVLWTFRILKRKLLYLGYGKN